MFRFATPEYLYLLLLIPLIVGLFLYTVRERRRALERFGREDTVRELMPEASLRRIRYKFILYCVAFLFIIFALGRPQLGSKLREVSREGIEIMLTVDVSNSMLAQDFEPSRLERTKFAIDRLIMGLDQDRIGMVVFAGDAYMQLPITADYVSARNFARNSSPDMLSRQGTAIGAAITLAASGFSEGSEGSRVIILITDGENHEDDALAAAEAAAAKGIKIYVIGVGTPQGAPIQIGDEYIRDDNGDMVVSKLDEATLENIAVSTGGSYIRATNRSIGLEEIIARVGEVEKRRLITTVFDGFDEQFQYLMAVALVVLLAEFLIMERRNRILSKFNIFNRE